MTEIRGTVEPGFEEVREVFSANFEDRGEVGAGFCVYVDGKPVVNLTGGVTDESGTAYDDSTLQMVFSTTKGAAAICAHLLVQRGQLDLLAPVTDYWPEFGANGKEHVPVSWLLSHKVGLPDVDRKMTLEEALDWDSVASALAESAPVWEPGTQHGYHAMTFGWLVGELVRRISGRSIGEFFAEEIAQPLDLEFWIGLPDDQQSRVAALIPMDAPEGLPMMMSEEGSGQESAPAGLIAMLDMFLGEGNLAGRALTAPGGAFSDELIWNEDRVRAAQIPAANGVTNAPSLARMYAACVGEVNGHQLLSAETVDRAIELQTEGPDGVLVFPIPFSFGFMRHSAMSPFAGERSFGHYGAGGSVGFADPDRRLAVGYVMNKMHFGLAGDPRTAALIEIVDRLVG